MTPKKGVQRNGTVAVAEDGVRRMGGLAMDQRRFEALAKGVGAAASRRAVLRLLGAALVAAGPLARRADPAAAGVPIYHCKIPGEFCKRDKNCCSRRCEDGICSCSGNGAKCYEPLRGAICCSGRCQNGKCKG